jgi:integrase
MQALAAEGRELEPITVHQCRPTCASFLIAAGANAKALSVVLGHASISITFDRYGHLMPGGEAEVGRLLHSYINGA